MTVWCTFLPASPFTVHDSSTAQDIFSRCAQLSKKLTEYQPSGIPTASMFMYVVGSPQRLHFGDAFTDVPMKVVVSCGQELRMVLHNHTQHAWCWTTHGTPNRVQNMHPIALGSTTAWNLWDMPWSQIVRHRHTRWNALLAQFSTRHAMSAQLAIDRFDEASCIIPVMWGESRHRRYPGGWLEQAPAHVNVRVNTQQDTNTTPSGAQEEVTVFHVTLETAQYDLPSHAWMYALSACLVVLSVVFVTRGSIARDQYRQLNTHIVHIPVLHGHRILVQ